MSRFLLGILLATGLSAQMKIFEKPLSPRIANYKMKAKLIPDRKIVEASWDLTWWNSSKDTIRELQFHMYLNAFKNEKSTFMIESGGQHRGVEAATGKDDWGYVNILSLKNSQGEELKKGIRFIHPDDDNADDQTVAQIWLSQPILPGKSISLHCDFVSKLPKIFARTGFLAESDFFMVGQWFPKIGVWENGGWNCHQFHSSGEFYADFGVYDMEITVPKSYVVGANAVQVKKEEKGTDAIYTYHQEDVIDAVWTASTKFKEFKQKVKLARTGREIEVTYLLAPTREIMIDRYFECVPAMFNYYDEWLGEYPYPNLTILDTPENAEGASGMEYPTLITTGSFFGKPWMNHIVENYILEVVTFHEFGHNYFQSLMASNEFEYPWLDEGFTQYVEHRASERYHREKGHAANMIDLWGLTLNTDTYNRLGYVPRPRDGGMADPAWKIPRNFYGTAAYAKPMLMLTTLERYFGEEKWNSIMRTYFERYHFRHPRPKDFIAVVNEISGQDMNWFFDQYVFSNKAVDYQVYGVRSTEVSYNLGLFDDGDSIKFVKKSDEESESDSNKIYENRYYVRNTGDAYFPTKILVRYDNGDSLVEHWDGKNSPKVFTQISSHKIVSVHVDPQQINLLDLNLTNNSKYTEPSTTGISRYTTRILFWLESLVQMITLLV